MNGEMESAALGSSTVSLQDEIDVSSAQRCCFFACLDILGFKNIVKQSTFDQLKGIVEAFSANVLRAVDDSRSIKTNTGASGAKGLSSYPLASSVVLYAQWQEVAHTTTTPVPVPHSYFDASCPTLLAEHEGDYEATALATAKNGCNKVWECYVAGISPTNATEKFTVSIELQDGVPVLSWNPDKKLERDYTIWGSTNLVNSGDWEFPTNALHRFFKVTVEMP